MLIRFIIALFIFDILVAFVAASAAESNRNVLSKPNSQRDDTPHTMTILSIIPAQGEPETTVTLAGSGFTSETTAFLGNTATETDVLSPKQLNFTIPQLGPGLYALFLKDADGTISRTYNFTVLPPKPVIYSLAPDSIQACASDAERQVVISGQNFLANSQVIFDGAAIRGTYISKESFSFIPPRVTPGLHQVQIKNSGDTLSGAQGLFIDAKPEIESVTQADEYVTYYNLVIGGRNFQQDSILVVSEERDPEQAGNQLSDVNIRRLRSGHAANPVERDRVIYVNCNRLVYQRFPYSTVPKSFKVQVINPSGDESSVVQVSAP
jgi:hypothetical protein